MKKYIRSIMITILLCILFLFLKNQYSSLLLMHSNYGMPALIKQGKIENLYIGSSMFRQGLDIMTLEDTMPNADYILAYNGNQPVLEYYQLKKLLDNNVKINHLWVDMYVYSAWEIPKISDEKIFMELDLKEKWTMWKLIEDESQTSPSNFFRMFVSSNNELLLTWPLNAKLIDSQFYQGGTLTKTSGSTIDVLSQMTAPVIDAEMNEIQKYYLLQLFQLAKENQLPVTLIETPKYEIVASDHNYLSAMSVYIQLAEQENIPCIISEQTARYLNISSCQTYTFNHSNPEYFIDALHLSYDGRILFTKLLINIKEDF